MDQAIAHSGHDTPIDLWVPSPELGRYLLRRLTDHLEASYQRAAEDLIPKELLPGDRSGLSIRNSASTSM